MKWFRSICFLTPILAATAGCISIPERSQIVGQRADGNMRVVSSVCAVDSDRTTGRSDLKQANNVNALDPGEISVLNWNIYKGNRAAWQDDLERLSARQDIVLLQEALLTDTLKHSLKMQGLKWYLNTAFYYDNLRTGVMTAAKIDSSYRCGLSTIEPIIRAPKTTLISHFPLAGMSEQLLVANIHGINFTLGLAAYREQLRSLEKILAQHHGPIILAGDFNNWSDGRTRLVKDMVERLSLQQLPYENHNRTMVFGSAIDHIFYRGLEVLNHKTHMVASSDHNPITVMFKASPVDIAWSH